MLIFYFSGPSVFPLKILIIHSIPNIWPTVNTIFFKPNKKTCLPLLCRQENHEPFCERAAELSPVSHSTVPSLSFYTYLHVCTHEERCMLQPMHVDVRGQSVGANSLLPGGSWGWHSGHWAGAKHLLPLSYLAGSRAPAFIMVLQCFYLCS